MIGVIQYYNAKVKPKTADWGKESPKGIGEGAIRLETGVWQQTCASKSFQRRTFVQRNGLRAHGSVMLA